MEFRPFQADPSKDARENAIAFLNWVVHTAEVEDYHNINQARYLKAIYEMLWNAGLRPGQPQEARPPQLAPGLPAETLRQGVDWVRQNADVFRSLFDLIRPKE